MEIEEDITGLSVDLTELEGDVNFLFDDQIFQNERILILEQDNDVFDDEIESKCFLQV